MVLGKHLIVELWVRDPEVLKNAEYLRDSLLAASKAADLSVMVINMHQFSPHGVTGVVLLAESHVSIHTWPEHGYAALDIFTCSGRPERALEELKSRLGVERVEVRELDRGVIGEG